MRQRLNRKHSQCDGCDRAEKCYNEKVIFGYMLSEDMEVYPEIGGNGHAAIRLGESCPKSK